MPPCNRFGTTTLPAPTAALSVLSDQVSALARSSALDLNGGESTDQEGYLGQRDKNDPQKS
ncbi:exported hypothetical protein [Stenotrophomonas maltophilia]|nr:exported hypothetical protein [Stenotrophomonas maltophilia]